MICQSTTRLVFLCLLLGVASRAQGGWLGPSFDLPGANGPIQSLVEFHGALYAVGNFTHIAGVNAPGVARWDGTNWVAVEPGFNATVVAATASGDAMYFTAFHNRLDQLAGLLRWDGSVWTALGTPQGYRDVIGPPLVNRTEIYTEVFPDTSSGDPFLTLAVAKW
ncbi:MAG TPA: hypothetical protein VFA77_07450, partial [Candidatus Eisenbacteria bacterium]|nr:hypothetical protein [Candidatus Eisenbacteria bacterium]